MKAAAHILVVHQHAFVTGPRVGGHYEKGEWCTGELRHSHPGGDVPHEHPETGPSYGYRTAKFTAKPIGEQFELVPLSEEDQSFELIITDSAMINATTPIGDTPLKALGFPAAERMMTNCRLKCIVRDERKRRA